MKKTWCAFLAALFCMPAGACSKKNADSNFVLLNGFENYESATRAAYKAIYGSIDLTNEHATEGTGAIKLTIRGRKTGRTRRVFCMRLSWFSMRWTHGRGTTFST